MDDPTAHTGPSPIEDASSWTSSAISRVEYGPGVIGLYPIPRLSKVTTRYEAARRAAGSAHEA
jgi:hypothetical protein